VQKPANYVKAWNTTPNLDVSALPAEIGGTTMILATGGTGGELINLSTRAFVGTAEGVLIPGLVVGGTTAKRVLVRAVGPTLTSFGVGGVLADPTLTVFSGTKAIASNDNWQDAAGSSLVAVAAVGVGASALPAGSKDSALVLTLAPGPHTLVVSGSGGTTGVALVEALHVAVMKLIGSCYFMNQTNRQCGGGTWLAHGGAVLALLGGLELWAHTPPGDAEHSVLRLVREAAETVAADRVRKIAQARPLREDAAGESATSAANMAPVQAAAFGAFASSVAVRWDERFLYVESDGLPAHGMMIGITAWQQQVPLPQPYRGDNAWRIPLRPVPAKTPVAIKGRFLRGAVALAANGVPIFNPQNNRGEISLDIGELDQWGGHCGRSDDYHYHIAPLHLQAVLGPAKPIAYALDGYAIYRADRARRGAPEDLDAYNGHDAAGLGYHYHASAQVSVCERWIPRRSRGARGAGGSAAARPRRATGADGFARREDHRFQERRGPALRTDLLAWRSDQSDSLRFWGRWWSRFPVPRKR